METLNDTLNEKLISSIKQNESLNIMKSLVSFGANGAHPEVLETLLTIGSCDNRLKKLKYFVEKCRANINDSDSFGRTPIMQARSVEIVTYLLSKKADVSMTDCRNTTVLMYLLENLHRRGNGLFDIFDQVLSLGANILTVNFRKKTAADILMKNERYFPVSFVSALNLILTEAETIKRQYLSVFGENARINLKLKRGSFISLCTFCANEKTSFHKHMNTDDIQKMFC